MGASRLFSNNAYIINCGDPSILQNIFSGGGSVCGWTRLIAYTANRRIVTKSNSSGWLLYYRTASSNIAFFADWSTGSYRQETNATMSVDVWRHVGVTYDSDSAANRAIIYVDGAVEASNAAATSHSGSIVSDVGANFAIGNNHIKNGAMNGRLSHIQAWDRIISRAEMRESMVKPGSIRDNLVGYWSCMGDSPERDLSGNGNSGTVTSATASILGPPISKF